MCFGCGPRALRFATVGLRPNVPQSSTPGPWGRCASGAGHGHCVSSRLAFGQMFLKAAPRPLVAGVLQVRATGTAFRHGWPAAKCSSQQRPRPLGRVCFRCGPVVLRFVAVGLRPNAPHGSAPALGAGVLQVRASGTAFRHGWPSAKCSSQQRPRPLARGSVSKFSTKNTPNVENTRKE